MLGKVGKAQELQDVTFVSDDGQQSSAQGNAHKTKSNEMPLLNCPFKAQLDIVSYGRACPSQHYVLFGRACPSLINALPNIISCFGKGMPTTVPFHISMPFHALSNPNMIWQSKEGHALPNISI